MSKYNITYVNSADNQAYIEIEANSKEEAKKLAKKQLGRECYRIVSTKLEERLFLNDLHEAFALEEEYSSNAEAESVSVKLNESVNKKTKKKSFKSLREGLKYFDQKEFDENCRCFELEMLYESAKSQLSNQDKKKLSDFIRTAKDAEEVNTYMTGLLNKEDGLNEARGTESSIYRDLQNLVDEYNENNDDNISIKQFDLNGDRVSFTLSNGKAIDDLDLYDNSFSDAVYNALNESRRRITENAFDNARSFAKHMEMYLPDSASWKTFDYVNGDELYYVTQSDGWTTDDFIKAANIANEWADIPISKLWVVTRDDSSYDFNTDLKRGKLTEIPLNESLKESHKDGFTTEIDDFDDRFWYLAKATETVTGKVLSAAREDHYNYYIQTTDSSEWITIPKIDPRTGHNDKYIDILDAMNSIFAFNESLKESRITVSEGPVPEALLNRVISQCKSIGQGQYMSESDIYDIVDNIFSQYSRRSVRDIARYICDNKLYESLNESMETAHMEGSISSLISKAQNIAGEEIPEDDYPSYEDYVRDLVEIVGSDQYGYGLGFGVTNLNITDNGKYYATVEFGTPYNDFTESLKKRKKLKEDLSRQEIEAKLKKLPRNTYIYVEGKSGVQKFKKIDEANNYRATFSFSNNGVTSKTTNLDHRIKMALDRNWYVGTEPLREEYIKEDASRSKYRVFVEDIEWVESDKEDLPESCIVEVDSTRATLDNDIQDKLAENYDATANNFNYKITGVVNESLTEAQMSDEDRRDNDLIRSAYAKINKRLNAKLTPEEQEVVDKYNLKRKRHTPYTSPGHDISYSLGLSDEWGRDIQQPISNLDINNPEVNLVDQIRKRPTRAQTGALAKDVLHPYGSDYYGPLDSILVYKDDKLYKMGQDRQKVWQNVARRRREQSNANESLKLTESNDIWEEVKWGFLEAVLSPEAFDLLDEVTSSSMSQVYTNSEGQYKYYDDYDEYIFDSLEDLEQSLQYDLEQRDELDFDESLRESKQLREGINREELIQLSIDLDNYISSQGIWADVYDSEPNKLKAEIDNGDWKHDHIAFNTLAIEWLMERGYEVWHTSESVDDEDGDDTYSSTHTLYIKKMEN